MKKLLLSFGFTFIFLTSFAQLPSFQWAAKMGGIDDENPNAIALDSNGNVYTTGSFYDKVDFDPGPDSFFLTSTGSDDCYISKLDASGKFKWVKQIVSTQSNVGYSVTIDAFGNVYILGYFQGTVDLNPNAGVANFTANGETDIFIMKLDTAGNFIWAKQIGGADYENAFSITTDASGNIYAVGQFVGTTDFNPNAGTYTMTTSGDIDGFILKLDSAGAFLWAKQIVGPTFDDEASRVALDKSGDVYIAGKFSGTADFDPSASKAQLTSKGGIDMFIMKLSKSGAFVWAKNIGNAYDENFQYLACDEADNIYLTGGYKGTVDFDPGTATVNMTSTGTSFTDIFLLKMTIAGNFVWVRTFSGSSDNDYGKGIAIDTARNVYLTGVFTGTIDFDPGAGTANKTSLGSYDMFILKLNAAGNYTWMQQMGGKNTDNSYAITMDKKGNIYTTGFFQGTVDFNPGTDSLKLKTFGYSDIFVQKMSQCLPPKNPLNITPKANLNICYGTRATLNISNTGKAGWYTAKSGGTYLGTGSNFTTPALKTGTSFYVQDSGCMATLTRTEIKVTLMGGIIDTAVTVTGNTIKAKLAGARYQWIDCANGNKPLAGDTLQTFKAKLDGQYAVIVKVGNCSDTSKCVLLKPSSVSRETYSDAISLFPNPTTGVFNLVIPFIEGEHMVEIFNCQGVLVGRQVITETSTVLHLDAAANGIYLLKVMKDGQLMGIRKVIKL